MFGRRQLDTLPKRSLSPVRAPRLALAGLLAFAIFGASGSGLSGRESSGGAAAAMSSSFPGDVSAVFEEAGDQAPACGGPGQRACCFLERTGPSCDAGFGEVALGQFPNACGGFGADTCMPLAAHTACGGEGQRACCFGKGDACQPGLIYLGDDLALTRSCRSAATRRAAKT